MDKAVSNRRVRATYQADFSVEAEFSLTEQPGKGGGIQQRRISVATEFSSGEIQFRPTTALKEHVPTKSAVSRSESRMDTEIHQGINPERELEAIMASIEEIIHAKRMTG